MTVTMPKIQTLVRAQTALARIELRCKITQISFAAVALTLSLLALAMLNVAAFLGLNHLVAPAWSALILCGVDLVLAGLLVQAATRVGPGPEAELAKEVRDIMLAEISNDAQAVRDEIEQVREDVQKIRSGFSMLTGGLPLGLAPLMEVLTRAMGGARSRAKEKGAPHPEPDPEPPA